MILNRKNIAILLIAVVGHFCVDMMIGIWAVFKTVAQLDLALAGAISAASAFLGEGMQLVFGHLSDRGHQKKLLIGGLLAAAGAAFLAYTHHYLAFFALFLLTCLGSGAFHPTAASLIAGINPERKGLMITLFAAGGTLGMAFSQILYTTIFSLCCGHTILLAVPLVIVIILVAISSFTLNSSQPKHSIRASFELLQRRDIRLLYISQVCSQAVFWAFLFFLPDILLSREYDSWIALGGGHLIAVIGGTCMLLPAGYLADRFSCKYVLLTALLLSSIFLYAVLYLPFLSNSQLFPLLFFLGATLSVTNAVSVAYGNQLAPEHPGKVSALLMGMVWCISEGLGQGGGGLLTKIFTEDAPARALAVLGTLLFISTALAWRLPRKIESKVTVPLSVSPKVIHETNTISS